MARGIGLLAALVALCHLALAVVRTEPEPRPLDDVGPSAPEAAVEPATADAPPRDIEELRRRVADVLASEDIPGVGLALIDRSGVLWAGGVGVADVESGRPVTDDTVFRVASITKSFVGLGVARLAEQGRLDLDAPLATTMPDIPIDNPWRDEAPVTLTHALEHTAGFDDMRPNEVFCDAERMDPARALAINPRSRRARWRPGSRGAYSNVGYSVAALAIERASGRPFDAYLQDNVLRPLGITRAAFERNEVVAGRLATGYRAPGEVAPFRPIAHRGAGALLASSRDLGRLVHFWLVRGEGFPQIVGPAMLARIERSETLLPASADNAYGLGNYGDLFHPSPARGHNGGLPGFSSNYRYLPELGVGYVVLLNGHSAAAMDRIRRLLFAYLTGGRKIDPPPPVNEDAHPWVGCYGFASPRNALMGFVQEVTLGWDAVASESGLLLTQRGAASRALVPTGNGGFRARGQGGTTLRFSKLPDGTRVFVSGLTYAEETSRAWASVRFWTLVVADMLLRAAPLWALGWVIVTVIRGDGLRGAGVVLWPAIASLLLTLWSIFLQQANIRQITGEVNGWTIGACAATIGFALASAAGMASLLRSTLTGRGPSGIGGLVPKLTAVAAFGITIWFGAHGLIGLRTWAW